MPPVQIYDPRTIPQSEGPFGVLSNQKNSFIAEAIDFRTDIRAPGMFPVDHIMESINQGKFCCQDFTGFNEIPMDKYLIPGGQLWFVRFVNANPRFDAAFRKSVTDRLALPFFLKWYDFIGIFGQAIGQPWIHTPFLDYCSVDFISHCKAAVPYLPESDEKVINSIPNESNPEGVTQIIIENPKVFNVKYSWDSSTGITV